MSAERSSRGCVVALLGPNGSGKTTVAELILRNFEEGPFRQTAYHHSRSLGALPKLGSLRGDQQKPRPRAHLERGTPGRAMVEPMPGWRAAIYPIYYALDMLLSRRALARMRKEGQLVVFDRYFYDYCYDRSFRRVPNWLLDILCRVVPEPDLILFPDRSTEQINENKPELTIEEIEIQQERIRRLLQRRSHGRVLDASHGPEDTALRACREIDEFVSAR